MSQVFFTPWVGRDYSSGGIFGKRILVLGDSHYCDEECSACGMDFNCECNAFTTKTILKYLASSASREGWMSTYLKFERSLVNHETSPDESLKIWNSLLFYNFLQVAMQTPRQAGTPRQYQDAAVPFFSIMDHYQPDLLIVWGVRLWNNLPSQRWQDGSEMSVDGYPVSNGYYRLSSDKAVRAICVYHPSVGYSWDYWHKVIKKAFDLI